VAPQGNSRPDYDIAYELAQRLGLGEIFPKDPRELKKRILGATSLHDVEERYVRSPGSPRVAFENRKVKTPSGRVNLIDCIASVSSPVSPQYPLQLMALSHSSSQCSQWIPDEPTERLRARVHPESAMGFSDAADCTLQSAIGSVAVRIVHDSRVRKGLVVLAKGGSMTRLRCANALTRAQLTDNGQGAALYQEAVRFVSDASL
jgi:predicted molibdopterin-dependent oxidoreductase YjgC